MHSIGVFLFCPQRNESSTVSYQTRYLATGNRTSYPLSNQEQMSVLSSLRKLVPLAFVDRKHNKRHAYAAMFVYVCVTSKMIYFSECIAIGINRSGAFGDHNCHAYPQDVTSYVLSRSTGSTICNTPVSFNLTRFLGLLKPSDHSLVAPTW